MEGDPFLLGVADLLDARGGLGLRAAVDALDVGRAEAARDAQAVHRGVAGAEDDDAAAGRHGRVLVREAVAAHEVHARQELVRAVDGARELPGDPEEARRARARPDEDGVVAHLRLELRDRERLADDLVRLELHAERLEVLHLAVDRRARQAEGRDPVLEDAADHVESLVDRDVGARLREVARAGEARGARADDRDLAERARVRRLLHDEGRSVVADEALEAPDRDGLHLALHEDALRLALALLRADAPADRGEEVALLDRPEGSGEVAHEDVADEAGNVDVDGAALDARRPHALDAALGLLQGVDHPVAEVHLEEVPGALDVVALGHLRRVGRELLELLVVPLLELEELLVVRADLVVVLRGLDFLGP